MRTITLTSAGLWKATRAVGLVALALLCLACTGLLASVAYIFASIGAERTAVALFAMSLCPVALVAIVGTLLCQGRRPVTLT
jgi:hypothetical protein